MVSENPPPDSVNRPLIDASGVVAAIDGAHAVVRMDETGCGRCHEHGGCGGQNIAKMFCSQPRSYRVLNPGNARIGDRVTVVIANTAVRHSAFFAYGIPLLALFAGAFGGMLVAGETGAIVGAVVGVLGAWLLLPRLERRMHLRSQSRTLPYIRR